MVKPYILSYNFAIRRTTKAAKGTFDEEITKRNKGSSSVQVAMGLEGMAFIAASSSSIASFATIIAFIGTNSEEHYFKVTL